MASQKTGNLKKGEFINDTYEIQFFIGEGAFGEVYRVKHKFMGTQVLKIFKEDYVAKTNIETVTAEAAILSRLTHPNVVRVFEANSFEKDGKKIYFVSMGFVSGENITELLARKIKLPAMQAIGFGIDLLQGLKYVQEQSKPIVHRDINTDNVLLSYENKKPDALLSDFGLAQSVDQLSKLPGAAGRYMYFAPECYLGTYLPTGDVFAVGVMFYKMLTGMHPWNYEFISDKPEEIANMIMSARKNPPKVPSKYNPEVPDYVDRAVMTALNLNLEDRYKLASHFLYDLREFDRDADYKIPETTVSRPKPASTFPNAPTFNFTNSQNTPTNTPTPTPTPPTTSQQPTNSTPSTFKPRNKGRGFDLVAGMKALKETLYQDLILPLSDKKLYEQYKVSVPNGMMLYGPPGCGKTFIAQKFAEEISYNYVEIKPSDLASIYVHGTQEKIGQLFREAKEKAPTIIFIDEVDAILPNREGNIGHHYSAEVNEFLAQMTECNQHGIFIICATNRPEKIDTAILRTGRIEKVIYLPPPDFDARKEMFQLHLSDRPTASDIDYENLSMKTNFYVSSDIKFLVNEASRNALKERAKITHKHLTDVIALNPPSISEKQLRKYEAFKNNRNFI
jgi:transitional endoplasmic reticulum ATPase